MRLRIKNTMNFPNNYSFTPSFTPEFLESYGLGDKIFEIGSCGDIGSYSTLLFQSYRKNANIYLFEKHIQIYKSKLHFYMGFKETDSDNMIRLGSIDNAPFQENINYEKIRKYLSLIAKLSHATVESILSLPMTVSNTKSACDLMKVLLHISTLEHLIVNFTNVKKCIETSNLKLYGNEPLFHLRLLEENISGNDDCKTVLKYYRIATDKNNDKELLLKEIKSMDMTLLKFHINREELHTPIKRVVNMINNERQKCKHDTFKISY